MNTEQGAALPERERSAAVDRSVGEEKMKEEEEAMRGEERKGEMSNRA